ncbi:MAG: hypothetical protein FK732_02755 [Asgard group archaeon]|nr:hypothetical protein [Asgard group archaeon]
MKLQRKLFRKLFKDKSAVSQILAAMMMMFLFISAIGVVFAWLYPTYNNFQTSNTINSVTTYMLDIDETIFGLFSDGLGSTEAIRTDPSSGRFEYEPGKNVSFIFQNAAGSYNESYTFTDLGKFSYLLENRRGVLVEVGDHMYLKGPSEQTVFFVNGSTDGLTYQGLTNLTLMRPDDKVMKMELDYRVRVYSWFDSVSNILSISIQLIQIDIKGTDFNFYKYQTMKILYNQTNVVYSDSTTVNDDFFVFGSIAQGFDPFERAFTFIKPIPVASYDVNIEIIRSQFLFYL